MRCDECDAVRYGDEIQAPIWIWISIFFSLSQHLLGRAMCHGLLLDCGIGFPARISRYTSVTCPRWPTVHVLLKRSPVNPVRMSIGMLVRTTAVDRRTLAWPQLAHSTVKRCRLCRCNSSSAAGGLGDVTWGRVRRMIIGPRCIILIILMDLI